MTCELEYYIYHLYSLGTSFSDIHALFLRIVQDEYAQKLLYVNNHMLLSDTINLPPLPDVYMSKDHIINAFLITFNNLKDHLFYEMSQICKLWSYFQISLTCWNIS